MNGQGSVKTMRLDFRFGFHACYATPAMLVYMLPYVGPIKVFFQDLA